MKTIYRISRAIILLQSIFLIQSCKKGELPTLTTSEVTSITISSAVGGGHIENEGTDTIISRGVCWSTESKPTISDYSAWDPHSYYGAGTFTCNISGLMRGTQYYVRAYASNSIGLSYGNAVTFTTRSVEGPIIFNPNLTYSSITDNEGNVYKTIQIGTQTWMAENLRTTKFNDNTSIPLITNSTDWYWLTTPGYCWYDNDSITYKDTYGALYNWYTVNTGKLCPSDWHAPSDAEWTTLTNYLGGESAAGGKLKETGISHWSSPNEEATNQSGFTALPSGYRGNNGSFLFIGNFGNWWSSTEYYLNQWTWFRSMSNKFNNVSRDYTIESEGFSVRCIKD
jgi:uncharacterized protein (TIGR02145 family)